MPTGFLERFLSAVDSAPEAVAFEPLEKPDTLSYAETLARAETFRATFEAQGVAAGETVLLAVSTESDLFASFLALASLGAIAVPIARRLAPFELTPICADAAPVGVVTTDEVDTLSPLLCCLSLRFVLTSAPDATRAAPWAGPTPAILALNHLPARRSRLQSISSDTIVSCHFTYRGLGYPLGALHTYGEYGWAVDAIIARHPGASGRTHLAALPLHPIYGFVAGLLMPLCTGSRVVILPHDSRVNLCDVLAERAVRLTCMVPLLLRSLLADARTRKSTSLHPDLEIITGGSLVPPLESS